MKTIVYPITHVGELSPPLAKLENAIGDAIAAANDAALDATESRDRSAAKYATDLLYKAHRLLDDTRRLPVSEPARYGIRTSLEEQPLMGRYEYIALGYEQWGKATIIHRMCDVPCFLLLNPLGEIVMVYDTLAEARTEADRLEGLASAAMPVAEGSATPIVSTDIRKLGSLSYGDRFVISGGSDVVYRRGLYSQGVDRRIACHRETPNGLSDADTSFAPSVEVGQLPVTGGMIKLCMLPEGALFKRQPDTTRTYRKGKLAKGKPGPRGKEFTGTDVEVPSFVAHFAIGETVFVADLV